MVAISISGLVSIFDSTRILSDKAILQLSMLQLNGAESGSQQSVGGATANRLILYDLDNRPEAGTRPGMEPWSPITLAKSQGYSI